MSTHTSYEEFTIIQTLVRQGVINRDIATYIGKHPSTIWRLKHRYDFSSSTPKQI